MRFLYKQWIDRYMQRSRRIFLKYMRIKFFNAKLWKWANKADQGSIFRGLIDVTSGQKWAVLIQLIEVLIDLTRRCLLWGCDHYTNRRVYSHKFRDCLSKPLKSSKGLLYGWATVFQRKPRLLSSLSMNDSKCTVNFIKIYWGYFFLNATCYMEHISSLLKTEH